MSRYKTKKKIQYWGLPSGILSQVMLKITKKGHLPTPDEI
jgi:hypothetical protein